MTLFEYVAVAASLVCSFSAVRLLGGITGALQPERRYWVHATWVCILLFLISMNWWLFWSYREIEWDYARFMAALLPLALLYVLCSLLVPEEIDGIGSWRAHFFSVRKRFYALTIVYVAMLVLNTVLLLGHPALHPRRVIPGLLGALCGAGLLSDSPRVHGAIVIGIVALNAVAAAIFLRPGSFGVAP